MWSKKRSNWSITFHVCVCMDRFTPKGPLSILQWNWSGVTELPPYCFKTTSQQTETSHNMPLHSTPSGDGRDSEVETPDCLSYVHLQCIYQSTVTNHSLLIKRISRLDSISYSLVLQTQHSALQCGSCDSVTSHVMPNSMTKIIMKSISYQNQWQNST